MSAKPCSQQSIPELQAPSRQASQECGTIDAALAIISTIALGVVTFGVAAYLGVGALRELSQMDGILAMAIGGGLIIMLWSIRGCCLLRKPQGTHTETQEIVQTQTQPPQRVSSPPDSGRSSTSAQGGSASDPEAESEKKPAGSDIHADPSSSPNNGAACGKPSFGASFQLVQFDLTCLSNLPDFSQVASGGTTYIGSYKNRDDFLNNDYPTSPPLIVASQFIPPNMIAHLMHDKKNLALKQKYNDGDQITNMEAVLHLFVTGIAPILMTGDYNYKDGHKVIQFKEGYARQVVLRTSIHPDFEIDCPKEDWWDVMYKAISLKDTSCEGRDLTEIHIPTTQQKAQLERAHQNLQNPVPNPYEEDLKKHLVYHLTDDHRLPSINEAKKQGKIYTLADAIRLKEAAISEKKFELQNCFVSVRGKILSLEMLFQTYVHQLRNEFSAYENVLTQGYVYCIEPPGYFALKDDTGNPDPRLGNRLQLLALSALVEFNDFKHLKIIAFNDFADPQCTTLLKGIFRGKQTQACSRKEIFRAEKGEHYSLNEGEQAKWVYIEANLSDAFGQNIEFEKFQPSSPGGLDGPTSRDAIVGGYSNGACVFKRERDDLTANLVIIPR